MRGQSKSTLSNYGRRIALFVIHFKELPEQVSEDEINEYLVTLARDPKSPSRSSFKHMVYGLRYYYSQTNRNVLKNLPEGVTLIGRIRKDTRLHKFPEHSNNIGRKKIYGDRIPTPEEIRQAANIEWQEVNGWVAGKEHTFNVKVVKDLRWENAGGNHNLQLVIIRPLRYRLTKKSRLLYRNPAYLICTDTNLDVEKLIQAYLWRWEIEVNFRDEKTLFGSGKAQVRNEHSVENVPAFIAAIYSYLLIAAHKTYKKLDRKKILPRPKWYPPKNNQRLSTGEIINLLRSQLWAKALGCDSFPAFVKQELETRSRKNYANPLSSAIFMLENSQTQVIRLINV